MTNARKLGGQVGQTVSDKVDDLPFPLDFWLADKTQWLRSQQRRA
ncbi:hypothetical protein [Neorhizobium sp. LjRoot104]